MDDENIVEEDEEVEEVEVVEPNHLSLGWRVIVGVVAIIVIGALGYSSIQERFVGNEVETPTEDLPAEVQATVAGPQATVQANPTSAESQFELGNAYYQSGQWNLATAAYIKAIELNPNYQAAYANLGATYYQQQRFDLATAQYEKALELNSDDGESAYNLGAIYLQQALAQSQQPDPERLRQAIDQIQRALEISPDLAEPHFTLGVAYMALNRQSEAIQAFEIFLSLDTSPDSQARQDAERYLQSLRGQ